MECRSGDGDLSFEQSDKSIRRYKELTVLYALWGGIFSNSYPEPLAPSATTWGDCLILDFPGTGFTAKMFRLCRQMITSQCRCIFALTVGVHCQICPAGYECHNFELIALALRLRRTAFREELYL